MARWWRDEPDDEQEQTLESMPVGLIQLDREWVVRYVNAAAEAMVGYTREELVGRSYWEAFPADVDNEFGRTYRQAVASGQPRTVEEFSPAPLNRWFEVRAVPTAHGLWLYSSEVTSRRQAQERLALLARVSSELAGTLDASTAVGRVPRLVVPTLASWATVTLLGEDGSLVDGGGWHVEPGVAPLVTEYARTTLQSLPATAPLIRAIGAGEAVTLRGPELTGPRMDAVATDRARELLELLAPGTLTVLPLRGRRRVLGALTLAHDRHRTVDPADAATAAEVADRVGLALDNTRLYQEQRRLARELQRSMLTAPPEPDHAQVVVRYLPATEAVRVGGDWYDAFLQPGGATNLVIGDVVGHDIAAAAAMGQLRSMLRGIAVTGDAGPAELLTQLDTALTHLQLHTYATAAIARLEQTGAERARGRTRLRWASAGHPPPLVLHSDGSLSEPFAWHGELMLGVDHRTPRSESVIELERGATVLLFTDGLVERRDQDLDAGTERLRAAVRELADRPLDELCDRLIDRLVDGRPDDDVALVAIRLHRQDRPRPDEAGPRRVPPTVRPEPTGR